MPKAPAKPHRRGGTHRVKDEHRTGTKWDNENYVTLKGASIAAGVYYKDIPKHEMIKKLAEHDARDKVEGIKKAREAKKLATEARIKKEKEEKEKEEARLNLEVRKADRIRRRMAGEFVGDSSEEEPLAPNGMNMGKFLSDSSEYNTDDDSTISSIPSPLLQHQKLRLFEWPLLDMPPRKPPKSKSSASEKERAKFRPELMPVRIRYVPLDLITTLSKEVLSVPGRSIIDSVSPDFVPRVSRLVANYARNGIMVGTLSKAIIESGVDWAKRTQVQWWNGRMYFHLPPRTSTISLADVYTKYSKLKQQQKKRPKSQAYRSLAQRKAEQDRFNKNKALEVYASSEYRPPICFLPASLDYEEELEDDSGFRKLEQLFYVRFPGCALPHYYFWVREGEWNDPATSNPIWKKAKAEEELFQFEEARKKGRVLPDGRQRPHARGIILPTSLDNTKTRIKRLPIPEIFKRGAKRLPIKSRPEATLVSIERQLYLNGIAATLVKYRSTWLDAGKRKYWDLLTAYLPRLYPAGKLPDAPPVLVDGTNPTRLSLAEKIVRIQYPGPGRPVVPIQGDEPWTRRDDKYWKIVDVPPPLETSESDIQEDLLRAIESPKTDAAMALQTGISGASKKSFESFQNWLDNVSPSHVTTTDTNLSEPLSGRAYRAHEREEWEKQFVRRYSTGSQLQARRADRRSSLRAHRHVSSVLGPHSEIESIPVAELKFKLHGLVDDKENDYCQICCEDLELLGRKGINAHYQKHHDEANETCPFCGMEWVGLDSEWKASHIFSHDFDDVLSHSSSSIDSSPHSLRLYIAATSRPTNSRRRSDKLLALPSQINTRSQSRRSSTPKVKFSPHITIGKRIAYNDLPDTAGAEADISSPPTPSPKTIRKSNLKYSAKSKGKTRKHNLKIDTKISVKKRKNTQDTTTPTRTNVRRIVPEMDDSSPVVQHCKSSTGYTATDPRKYSISSEAPSPYLARVKRHRPNQPSAAWDASRRKSSTEEKHECYIEKGAKAKSITLDTSIEMVEANVRGKRKRQSEEDLFSSNTGLLNPETSSKERKTKRLKIGQEVADVLPPLAPGSDSGTHRTSTVSNAGTVSDEQREEALEQSELDDIAVPRKLTPTPDQQTFRSREDALLRRLSGIAELDDQDYIAFEDEDLLLLDNSEDVLRGNPFAPAPKKGRNRTDKSKVSKSMATTKISRDVTGDQDRADVASGPCAVRARRKDKAEMDSPPVLEALMVSTTHVSGKEPTMRRASINNTATATAVTTELANISNTSPLKPSTPPLHTISTLALALSSHRTRRSSAPTPSPSLQKTISPKKRLPPIFPISTPQPLPKRPSYDIPYSDTRPIVPPNTPATRRASLSAAHERRRLRSHDAKINVAALDINTLKDKIDVIKTTRAGLVRGVTKIVIAQRTAATKDVKKPSQERKNIVKNSTQSRTRERNQPSKHKPPQKRKSV